MIILYVTDFIGGSVFGASLMYWHTSKPVDVEQLHRVMSRMVNIEAMEENAKLTKLRMARAGQKTRRVDGGPNARVMRLKIKPTLRRR